jgi:hypothetical protein
MNQHNSDQPPVQRGFTQADVDAINADYRELKAILDGFKPNDWRGMPDNRLTCYNIEAAHLEKAKNILEKFRYYLTR